MKRIILAAAITVVTASSVFAAGGKANTGCGLGTVLWAGRADGSILSQAFQATTNQTFGNQTFGITSGTLECGTPGKAVQNERLNHFVRANMDNLALDIAQGHGESLDAFAELLQVPAEKRPGFYAALQSNFSSVFTSENVVVAEVIDNAVAVAN
ncbi:DUF3015 family protein [Geobacter benzoatilyticus]|uniref:DUF3015 family protein n=1 Tax=Geobacter benzoatilyticus TaxID=2815309 RepID=A0ABX7Q5C3_9BACT|nr:DUF3015 family protein [Geobacter benzoatilyticus]QSV46185.1 DUF3015 family protein [Geobacter benzoatilyticus]